jgi:hypothetical protein
VSIAHGAFHPGREPEPYAGPRVITIRQPWAQWITLGVKLVENRTWQTKHRGTLLIHAGAAFEEAAFRHPIVKPIRLPSLHRVPASAILAVVDLDDCHPYQPGCCTSPWAEKSAGVWHWTLANVRELPEPVACTGRLGLWRPSAEVLERVTAQLGGAL